MYNNYLHIKPLQLADMLFDSTFLSLFSVAFCQKYIMLETDLMSEEGHFSPLVEGVKHLSNPLILRFSFEKSLKSTDFYLFWFLFWVGKDNLHYSV